MPYELEKVPRSSARIVQGKRLVIVVDFQRVKRPVNERLQGPIEMSGRVGEHVRIYTVEQGESYAESHAIFLPSRIPCNFTFRG